ncbi:pseudouridine synthase [Flagelloscypha sp. PMI_526]|nr:pseudouridine synthase [Flagelloscypha sp. PMI_526]
MSELKRSLSPSPATTSAKPSKRPKSDEKGAANAKQHRNRRGKFNEPNERTSSGEPRLPKRQCALIMSYCGSSYRGMQFQPDTNVMGSQNTIENAIFKAMVDVGAVSKDNSNDPVKVSLARAARTDAGVHAAGNLISLKLNEALPEDIRIWGYVRTLNSFNARTSCDSRKYTYFFPSYMLLPSKRGSGQHSLLQTSRLESLDYSFWDSIDSSEIPELEQKRSFRAPPVLLERLRHLAAKYLGAHNFHNFTVGREFRDKSCIRYMKAIEVAEPVVYGDPAHGTEWIAVMFHGQSFMLHQIRKMMSALIMLARSNAPISLMDQLFMSTQVQIPKAPALGLLLENPLFDSYNTRVQEFNANEVLQRMGETREILNWDQYSDQIHTFKEKQIYPVIRGIEERDGLFHSWLTYLDSYSGKDFLYLNSEDGSIPAEAVRPRGEMAKHVTERRENPFREKKKFDATTFNIPGKTSHNMEMVEADDDEDESEIIDKKQLTEMEG